MIKHSGLQLRRYLLLLVLLTVELAEINVLPSLRVALQRCEDGHRLDVKSVRNLAERHLRLVSEFDHPLDVKRPDFLVVPPALGFLLLHSFLRRGTLLLELLLQRNNVIGERLSLFC